MPRSGHSVRGLDHPAIDSKIVFGHASREEAHVKGGAHLEPVQITYAAQCSYGLVIAVDNEAGCFVFKYLGDRAAAKGHYRRAARHRLNHHQPERLWPIDREKECRGLSKKCLLFLVAQFADELDQAVAQLRLDLLPEKLRTIPRNLGRYAQWHIRTAGDADGRLRALLRRDAAKKCKIPLRLIAGAQEVCRHTVI